MSVDCMTRTATSLDNAGGLVLLESHRIRVLSTTPYLYIVWLVKSDRI